MKSPAIQEAVLVYIVKNNKILLAKKVKKVNAGTYTSYGGKFENGESELECVCRELKEESGVSTTPASLKKMAIIDFHNSDTDVWRVHTYITSVFKGKPKSTPEMKNPKWFPVSKMPFKNMPWSDQYWLPLIISGKKLRVIVHKEPLSVLLQDLVQ